MAFNPANAKLVVAGDVGVQTADAMDATDKAGGIVDVKLLPDGTVINNSTSFNPARAKLFNPNNAKLVESAKPVVEAKPIQKTAVGDIIPQVGQAEAGAALASGAVAAPVAGLSGIGAAIAKALGLTDAEPADVIRKVQEAMTYEPKSETGKQGANFIAKPFELLAKGADKAGGAVTDVTGSPALGAAVNTGIQALPLAAGRIAKTARAGADSLMTEGDAAAAVKQQQMAVFEQGVKDAKDAGYRLPPSQVNPSLMNQAVEGTGGGPKVLKRLSAQNQEVTNNLARKDLGLPETAPLTMDTLEQVRREASKPYEAIKETGMVTASPEYFDALQNIAQRYKTASEGFPKLSRDAVGNLVEGLSEKEFSASSAIEQIKILAEDANKAFKAGETGLGKANRQAMSALEDELGRHLERIGSPPDVIANYLAAKTKIAKTYAWQGALKADGNIDAVKVGKQLESGKPMTGELETVGKFGSQFPRAAQMGESTGGNPFSIFDAGIGVAGALHNPTLIGLMGARPALRATVTSRPYQGMFVNSPTHGPGLTRRSLSNIGDFQNSAIVPLSEMTMEQRK